MLHIASDKLKIILPLVMGFNKINRVPIKLHSIRLSNNKTALNHGFSIALNAISGY